MLATYDYVTRPNGERVPVHALDIGDTCTDQSGVQLKVTVWNVSYKDTHGSFRFRHNGRWFAVKRNGVYPVVGQKPFGEQVGFREDPPADETQVEVALITKADEDAKA